jgi:predicted ABC-type ATPase
MDYSKPTLFVISGPPGAGKSTYGSTLLPDELWYLDIFKRDEMFLALEKDLKEHLPPGSKHISQVAAMMMNEKMEKAIATAIKNKEHFAFETPLAHPNSWEPLLRFLKNDYQLQLAYLCLDNVDDCQARVQHRVSTGGLFVPPDTVEGVYRMNLKIINVNYHGFEKIDLYDGMGVPKLLVSLEHQQLTHLKPEARTKKWIIKGLPLIGKKIQQVLPPIKQKGMRL